MTSSPHDALFKAVFSDPANEAGELRTVLAKPIGDTFRWPTLALMPGSFVDAELTDRHTDLLFCVERNNESTALIYVLFEHQSTPDPWMGLRLLEYVLRIWRAYRKANPEAKTLPLIVPVVLYQGEDAWTARSLGAIVDAEEAERAFVPDFAFVMDDLRRVTDADLRARPLSGHAQIALSVMREARTKSALDAVLLGWKAEVQALLAEERGPGALAQVLEYIAQVRDVEVARLVEVARQLGPEAEDVMMTLEQRLIQKGKAEGEAQGKAEGKAEGRAESIFAVLAARGIEVSAAERARVLECRDIATLDHG